MPNNQNFFNRSGTAALSSHSQSAPGRPSSSNGSRSPQAHPSPSSHQSALAHQNRQDYVSKVRNTNTNSRQNPSTRTLSRPKPINNRQGSLQRQNSKADFKEPNVTKKLPARSLTDLFRKMVPDTVYSTKSKKIFGFFNVEDLLLVMLIFLLLEKETEDDTLLALALLYVLVSDYIDLSGFTI